VIDHTLQEQSGTDLPNYKRADLGEEENRDGDVMMTHLYGDLAARVSGDAVCSGVHSRAIADHPYFALRKTEISTRFVSTFQRSNV
jgi:hypothetical protein